VYELGTESANAKEPIPDANANPQTTKSDVVGLALNVTASVVTEDAVALYPDCPARWLQVNVPAATVVVGITVVLGATVV
jgi:hypothetical protein